MDFYPSVYEHAAFLIGRTPWEVSRNSELLYQAHRAAYLLYRHSPIVVGIDIYNLEAEAYGARVQRPSGTGVPGIVEPAFERVDQLQGLPFLRGTEGRIPRVLEVAQRLAAEFPEADVRIPLSGPFSIASNLLTVERLLVEVADRPTKVMEALFHLAEAQAAFCRLIHERGLDVAFFESAAAPPLLSPKQFRDLELPALKATMRAVEAILQHPVPCIIGGNTAPIVEALLETGTQYLVCPIETNQEAFMQKVWHRTDVRIRINTSSEVMVRGDRQMLQQEAERIARLAAGRPNVCMGTGALPYETPPENVLFLKSYCEKL